MPLSIARYDCAIFYFPRLAPAFLYLHESDVLNICKSQAVGQVWRAS